MKIDLAEYGLDVTSIDIATIRVTGGEAVAAKIRRVAAALKELNDALADLPPGMRRLIEVDVVLRVEEGDR